MRYSEVVGQGFLGIGLTQEQIALVDAHFLGAAHHLRRYEQSVREGTEFVAFHQEWFWRHYKALIKVVIGGNFENALDLSGQGFQKRDAWVAKYLSIPGSPPIDYKLFVDDEMFALMWPDARCDMGEPFFSDLLLENPKIKVSQILFNEIAA